MNVRVIKFGLVLAAALVIAASPSFARPRFRLGKSSTKSVTVTFIRATKLSDKTVLPPGDYTIKIPDTAESPEVEFYSNEKLVAKAQPKVETQPQKNDYTSFEAHTGEDTDVLIAVNPEGLAEKLVFGADSVK